MHLKRSRVLTCVYPDFAPLSTRASEDVKITVDRSVVKIDKLARALAAHDRSTHEHAQRVQRHAVAVAREAGISDLRLLETIHIAALLHDIGKIGVPDSLLNKPGPLTPDEYDQVKQHASIGAIILKSVALPNSLALLVRHHHENWDGTGYPDRLNGDAIPIGARVLAIVDCYDALTSDRPYRDAMSHARAVAMIQDRRGSMYDPAIVDAFLRIVHHLRFTSVPAGADACNTAGDWPEQQARAV